MTGERYEQGFIRVFFINNGILPVGMGSHVNTQWCISVTELQDYWYRCLIDIVIRPIGMGSHINTDSAPQTWIDQVTDTRRVIPQGGGMEYTIIITQQVMQTVVLLKNHGCLTWWKWCNPWTSRWIAVMTVQVCPTTSICLLCARVLITHSMSWVVLVGRSGSIQPLRFWVLKRSHRWIIQQLLFSIHQCTRGTYFSLWHRSLPSRKMRT